MNKKILIGFVALAAVLGSAFWGATYVKSQLLGLNSLSSEFKNNFTVSNTSTINGILVPDADLGADIGSPSLRFDEIFAEEATFVSSTVGTLSASSIVTAPLYVTNGTATTTLSISGTNSIIKSDAGDLLVNATGGNFAPSANDGAALGIAATGEWSDMFLASGSLINWNNGDLTLTHSANTLAFTGGVMRFDDDQLITFGTADDAVYYYNASQTPDSMWFSVAQDSRSIILAEGTDRLTDFAFAQQTNPTFVIQSADATNINQRLYFAHNQTNGEILTGVGGNLMLSPSTTNRILVSDTVSTTLHLNNATGDENALAINYTTNKETSGNDTGLLINHVDTASPGTSNLFDFQLAGTSKLSMLNDGKITHTISALAGSETASTYNFTTANSGAGNGPSGMLVNLIAGYLGSGFTSVLAFDNNVAGTSVSYSTDATYGSRPNGNRGVGGFSRPTTAGHNVGGLFLASKGNVNYGIWSGATVAKNGATNVGIIGIGRNTGTTPTEIGGYFLLDDPSAVPIFNTSTALLADANTSGRNPFVVRKENSTVLFAVYNNGNIDFATSSVQIGIQNATESGAGGTLTIQSGDANTSGNGGNITLIPGAAAGGGNTPGLVVVADAASASAVGAFGSQAAGDFSIYTQQGVTQISLSTSGATDSVGFRVKPVASGVNFLEVTNAVTTGVPLMSATGTDANINMSFLPKGTGKLGIATSTPGTIVDIYTNATTTLTIDSNHATRGGCLKVKDFDGAGYSYGVVNDGAVTWSTVSCE